MSGLQPVDRIEAVRPVPSLLTSARDRSSDNFGGPNWRTGIAWSQVACHVSRPWPRCPDPLADIKAEPETPALAGTDAFELYTMFECDQTQRGQEEALARDVDALTDVHTAFAVSRALWLGEGLPDRVTVNGVESDVPTLRRAATDLGTPAGDLDDVFARLLDAYEDCTGGNGGATIHLPAVAVPFALGGGTGGGVLIRPEGDLYRGPLRSVVSPGPGYPSGASAPGAGGFGPRTTTPPADDEYAGTAADEIWVYVTGPVEWAASAIEVVPAAGMERREAVGRMNRYVVEGKRDALVRFDPCCTFAALATNPVGVIS